MSSSNIFGSLSSSISDYLESGECYANELANEALLSAYSDEYWKQMNFIKSARKSNEENLMPIAREIFAGNCNNMIKASAIFLIEQIKTKVSLSYVFLKEEEASKYNVITDAIENGYGEFIAGAIHLLRSLYKEGDVTEFSPSPTGGVSPTPTERYLQSYAYKLLQYVDEISLYCHERYGPRWDKMLKSAAEKSGAVFLNPNSVSPMDYLLFIPVVDWPFRSFMPLRNLRYRDRKEIARLANRIYKENNGVDNRINWLPKGSNLIWERFLLWRPLCWSYSLFVGDTRKNGQRYCGDLYNSLSRADSLGDISVYQRLIDEWISRKDTDDAYDKLAASLEEIGTQIRLAHDDDERNIAWHFFRFVVSRFAFMANAGPFDFAGEKHIRVIKSFLSAMINCNTRDGILSLYNLYQDVRSTPHNKKYYTIKFIEPLYKTFRSIPDDSLLNCVMQLKTIVALSWEKKPLPAYMRCGMSYILPSYIEIESECRENALNIEGRNLSYRQRYIPRKDIHRTWDIYVNHSKDFPQWLKVATMKSMAYYIGDWLFSNYEGECLSCYIDELLADDDIGPILKELEKYASYKKWKKSQEI